MSLPLLLWQCSTYLAHPFWMVFKMGVWWCPYSCFVGCCLQDLFNTAHSILVYLSSSFFFICLVSVHVVHPYSSIDKLLFILSDRSDFHINDSQLIAFQPSLVACWYHFQLMRRCFQGRWTCPQISKIYHLALIKACIMFCLCWHRGLCPLLPIPDYAARIGLE